MAGKSAVFSLRVVADAKQASGELSKLERAIQGVESGVDKMTPAASVAGAALVGFGAYAGPDWRAAVCTAGSRAKLGRS